MISNRSSPGSTSSSGSSPRTGRCSTARRRARRRCSARRLPWSSSRRSARAASARSRSAGRSSPPGTRTKTTVLEVIRDHGLELQVIFNKGAVMVLPSGVNKATGLSAALAELGLSPHNAVGVGDAENDHAFLKLCECAVAVANALPSLKEQADLVTRGDHGAGVVELIDRMLADGPRRTGSRGSAATTSRSARAADGSEVSLRPYGVNVLLAGSSRRRQVDARDGDHRAPHRARLPVLHHRPRGRLRHARGRGRAGRQQPPAQPG